MGVVLTEAFESLKARLDAEGKPLVIDRFIFAHIPGQDHTQAPPADQTIPANVVHTTVIPPEYRAWVNPNQVVYSAFLGSDVGGWAFNWQGLYCSEYDTLCAVATFPEVQKKLYDADSNTPGNNITRNFLMSYDRAQGITQVSIEAAVWQLDFTVRLKGIDERERLSNRDIYGDAAFLEDAWLLTATEGEEGVKNYAFAAGSAYVGGARAALGEALPVNPVSLPCDVWLDVSMPRLGSDVITEASPLFMEEGAWPGLYWQYQSVEPFRLWHYCAKVAHIDAEGNVTDLRKEYSILPDDANDGDVLVFSQGQWKAGKPTPPYEVGQYYPFQDERPREGMIPLLGHIVPTISNYPEMIAYLESPWGAARLVSQEEYDARHIDFWHTNADGSKVGWDGEGGVNVFVWDKDADTLLVPDLTDMYQKQIAGDAPGVGGVQGDGIRNIPGTISAIVYYSSRVETGALYYTDIHRSNAVTAGTVTGQNVLNLDPSRVVPVFAKNYVQSFESLYCLYVGPKAS